MLGQQIASLFAKIGVDVSDAKQGLRQFDMDLRNASTQISLMSKAATMGFAALGAAAVGGIGFAVKSAMDLEQRMSGLQAVSGATGKEMESLRQTAMGLGATWGQSASDVVGAMEEMAKAGISTKDIMGGAAEGVMTLAAAGGTTLAEAAEIAANAINVFNLKGKDMSRVADLMAGAANASVISVNDVRLSLQMASAVMTMSNQTIEDATIAITEMGAAGIKGSDAGTSLKTMFLSLNPTTKEAGEQMRALGIITSDGANRFFDATGKARSYRDISQILADATANLSEQQRLSTLQTMFGTDAIRAATVAAKNGAEGYDKYMAIVGNTSALDQAQTRTDNLAGSIGRLKATAENYAAGQGGGMIPVVKGATDALADFIASLDYTANATAAQRMQMGDLTKTGHSFAEAWAIVRARTDEVTFSTKAVSAAQDMLVASSASAIDATRGLAGAMSALAASQAAAQQIIYNAAQGRWAMAQESEEDARHLNQVYSGIAEDLKVHTASNLNFWRGTEEGSKKAASAAERLAEKMADMARDTGRAIRDVQREMGGLGISLMNLQQDFGDRWIEEWFEVDRAIKGTISSAERALTELSNQEVLNTTTEGQRRALEARLSAEDILHRQQVEDEELIYRLGKDLSRAKTEDERASIRERFEWAKDDLAHQRDLDRQEVEWRKKLEAERDEFNRQLHEDEVNRRRAAIIEERNSKITAINDEWTEWQKTEAEKLEKAKENARAESAARLLAMKENFFDKLADAAMPGTQAFADQMASAISGALATISMPGGGGGGGGGEGGGGEEWVQKDFSGYTDPRHAPGGDIFEEWKQNEPEQYEAWKQEHGMASGGVVTGPTLALLGESGPEAVVPLSRGYGGITVQVHVYGSVTSERDLARSIREQLLALGQRNVSVGLG